MMVDKKLIVLQGWRYTGGVTDIRHVYMLPEYDTPYRGQLGREF